MIKGSSEVEWCVFLMASERDSLMVKALACHAADPGSNPAGGDDFFNY